MLEKLLAQQHLLQSYLLESSNTGIALLDTENRIVDCNQGFMRLFQLAKKPVRDLLSLYLDLHAEQQCVSGSIKLTYQVSQAVQGVLECHTIPVEAGCLLICEKLVLTESKVMEALGRMNNELTGMQRDLVKKGMLLDRLNRELAEARDTADAANHAKSDFLAAMSHEIRTPMSGVIGLTQLLRFTELTGEQQEYLEHIETSADNLLAIINDILDLSKIEAGKIELEHENFSLHDFIKSIAASQMSMILGKGLNIDITVVPDLPLIVCGDQLRVKQILLNLLSNAVKFTGKGRIGIETALLEKHESHVVIQITVSDSGIGMSPAALGRIFDPFTQADASTSRRFGGTGLGLSICRQLAELMKGRIWAESEEGKGSRFHLELPFTVPFQVPEAAAVRQRPEKTAPTESSLTILLVEDEPLNQRTSELLLQKMGHHVKCADNGKTAVEIWRQGGIDLILMDIQMPVMNGMETLQAIRSRESATGKHIPIVAQTADVLKETAERLLSGGFDGYLAKPFRITDLQRVLQQASIIARKQ